MSSNLSWGLTVCTYNRAQFLMQCLKYILAQTRLPSEIVVVDASDYWEDTYNTVLSTYEKELKGIRLVYQPAKVRSLTYQRNQALELSQSDIIFSLDDDIYLFPDAAAIIMEAYETDVDEEIAMIGGHFTAHSPGDAKHAREVEPEVGDSDGVLDRVRTTLEEQLSLDKHFAPYDQPVDDSDVPESVEGLDVYPGGLVNGGRTTFRRRFGIQVRWSQLLRYYATHEDSDFSYRMSKFGRLLVAPKAGFFHADGNDSRFSRFKINTIRVRNLMALHRVWSDSKLRSSWRLLATFCFFMALYLVIDPARKRFSFPIVRAYALGAAQIPMFMFYPFGDFKAWYLDLQEKMYRAR